MYTCTYTCRKLSCFQVEQPVCDLGLNVDCHHLDESRLNKLGYFHTVVYVHTVRTFSYRNIFTLSYVHVHVQAGTLLYYTYGYTYMYIYVCNSSYI